jgi:hypothetical protein
MEYASFHYLMHKIPEPQKAFYVSGPTPLTFNELYSPRESGILLSKKEVSYWRTRDRIEYCLYEDRFHKVLIITCCNIDKKETYRTIFVDLDGTVCTEEKTFERSLATPLPGARESLRKLKTEGHTIIIYSARSWSELRVTENWLKENDIPFDGIHLGKPVASLWIDDRAVSHTDWETTMSAVAQRTNKRGS